MNVKTLGASALAGGLLIGAFTQPLNTIREIKTIIDENNATMAEAERVTHEQNEILRGLNEQITVLRDVKIKQDEKNRVLNGKAEYHGNEVNKIKDSFPKIEVNTNIAHNERALKIVSNTFEQVLLGPMDGEKVVKGEFLTEYNRILGLNNKIFSLGIQIIEEGGKYIAVCNFKGPSDTVGTTNVTTTTQSLIDELQSYNLDSTVRFVIKNN